MKIKGKLQLTADSLESVNPAYHGGVELVAHNAIIDFDESSELDNNEKYALLNAIFGDDDEVVKDWLRDREDDN